MLNFSDDVYRHGHVDVMCNKPEGRSGFRKCQNQNTVKLTLNSNRLFTEIHIFRPSFYGLQYGYPSYIAYPRIVGLDFKLEMRFNFTLAGDVNASTKANAVTGTNAVTDSALMIFMGQETSQY